MKKDGTEDLRIKRTHKSIKESFFRLVEANGFEHISVKDITDGAMISRNTFYLHYKDKYELLNRICDELMRTLFFGVGKQLRRVQRQPLTVDSVASVLVHGFNAVNADRDEYRILFSGSSSDILTAKITGVISRCIDMFNEGGAADSFSAQYITSGVIGLIRYYVSHEVDGIEEKCKNFTGVHLGKIIDAANERRRAEYEEKG